jgi:hypothetical protein
MKESLVVSYCRAAASRKKKNRALLTTMKIYVGSSWTVAAASRGVATGAVQPTGSTKRSSKKSTCSHGGQASAKSNTHTHLK